MNTVWKLTMLMLRLGQDIEEVERDGRLCDTCQKPVWQCAYWRGVNQKWLKPRQCELEALITVTNWLRQLERRATVWKPAKFGWHYFQFVLNMNEKPPKSTAPDALLEWLAVRSNALLFNRACWEIVAKRPRLMKALRDWVHRDLRGPDKFFENSPHTEDHAYGQVFHKQYARDLVEHFLRPDPRPDWVATDR